MANLIDLTGQTFGKLTVIEHSHVDQRGQHYWLCQCQCLQKKVIVGLNLRYGVTKSCGCLRYSRKETKHGHTQDYKISKTYHSWQGMKTRCLNPNSSDYSNYGGRGIKICPEWINSFEKFLEDMGERPDKHTLDRIDVNGDYTIENTKWSNIYEQNRNKRTSFLVTFRNETKPLKEWVEILKKEGVLDIDYMGVIARLNKGWTPEKAFLTPSLRTKKK